MIWRGQLVLCANGGAQDRPLKILVKLPAGALVHGKLPLFLIIAATQPQESLHKRTYGRFPANNQRLGLYTRFCTSEH
jgi:hypothetical protein